MVVAVCALHREQAVAECVRCGDYVCARCRVYRATRPHCRSCAERVGRHPSRRARLSLLFASLGALGGIPALVGLVLAERELRDIARGRATSAGEDSARTARKIALFYLIAFALAIAWHLVR